MNVVPENLRYTRTHEWIRQEGYIAIIGITDHAQRELTDIVYVELPSIGKEVKAGDTIAIIESVKAASEVYAPVGGKVVEVNNILVQNPGLINLDPYGEGWLVKIEISNPSEIEALLDAVSYSKLLA